MISIRIRQYPWQWKSENYTMTDKDHLNLNFCGCPLLEIPHGEPGPKNFVKYLSTDESDLYLLPLPEKNSTAVEFKVSKYFSTKEYSVNYNNIKQLDSAEADQVYSYIKFWLSFFDEVLLLGEKSDVKSVAFSKLNEYIKETIGDENEKNPYYAIIVKICNDMKVTLPVIVHGLRKILKSQGQLLPVNRINELDSYCLRWIVRQPGKTVYEKASSNRFRLMGIARKENYDLLENRVLKDFLFRCRAECTEYINNLSMYPNFKNSERFRNIRKFGLECEEYLKTPAFENVTRQISLTMPNYVLQNDVRYKKMWKFYKLLIKKEKEIDSVWKWQHVTFSDISLILLQASLCSLSLDQSNFMTEFLTDSLLELSYEQSLGSKVNLDSIPGPFHSVVDNIHLIISFFDITEAFKKSYSNYSYINKIIKLTNLGTRVFIKIEVIGSENFCVIPVYFLHTAYSKEKIDYKALAHDAGKYCTLFDVSNNLSLRPLVFCSSLSDEEPVQSYSEADIVCVNVKSSNWLKLISNLRILIQKQIISIAGASRCQE